MINILSLNNDLINEIKVKNMDDANIYRKCGYKNTNDFIKLYSGNYKNNVLEIWGKNKGLQKYKNAHTIFDILYLSLNVVTSSSTFIVFPKYNYVSIN